MSNYNDVIINHVAYMFASFIFHFAILTYSESFLKKTNNSYVFEYVSVFIQFAYPGVYVHESSTPKMSCKTHT